MHPGAAGAPSRTQGHPQDSFLLVLSLLLRTLSVHHFVRLPPSALSVPESPGSVPVRFSFGDVVTASRILLLSFWNTHNMQDSLLKLFFPIH